MRTHVVAFVLAFSFVVAPDGTAHAARRGAPGGPRERSAPAVDLRAPSVDARGWMPDVARRLDELRTRHGVHGDARLHAPVHGRDGAPGLARAVRPGTRP